MCQNLRKLSSCKFMKPMRFYKHILFYTVFVFASFFAVAQQDTCHLYVTANFEQAKKEADINNKKILLVFSGSDWCHPCIMFEKDIIETPKFIAYANKKLIVYKADFPRRKANLLSDEMTEQNNSLAKQYNNKGEFPKVLLLSSKGDILKSLKYYQITVQDFINQIN